MPITDIGEWARKRLEQESVTSYLARLSKFERERYEDSTRDIMGLVLVVKPLQRELMVSDGSTRHLVRISALSPSGAAERVFTHIRCGDWLKLRPDALDE